MMLTRQGSERYSLDEVEYSSVGLSRFHLRGHMTRSVNSYEGELLLTNFDVAGNLVVDLEGSPCLKDLPADFLDPLLSSVCRDSTIGVTRELKHLILSVEVNVDLLGSLST